METVDKRICVLAFLLAGVAAAQQKTPLVNGDVYSCFNRSDGGAVYSLVDAEGQPFTKALRIRTQTSGANPWSIRVRCFATNAAAKGDTALATFWMRTLSSKGGRGYTTFVIERGGDPYTKSSEFTANAGNEWKKIEIPFTFAETYAAGAYNISFWVTFDPQEIEIGGLTMENWGQNVPYSQLGLTMWPYEGRALDAPWRKEAARRIDKYRKTDILVVARDENGNPLANVPVRVKMKRHAFGFGTAVAGDELRTNAKFREMFLENFNKAVIENDLKWPFWETWGRPNADWALPWLQEQKIPVRGHNVIWPGRNDLPNDVKTLIDQRNSDALRKRINDHIAEVMAYTKGKVTEWDVLNEPYTSKDVQALLGDAEMAEWFKKARTADPDVKLYINDYNIVEAGGSDFKHQDHYFNTIKLILDNGGPIDGIGLQGHFNNNLTPPERVWEIYDRFASFGKELQITEFDVNVPDEQIQADYMRDFLTASFAHPAMAGFMNWGYWEARHWLPTGALFRRDWSIKPNGQVWRDLIYRDWWTDVQGTTGQDGAFRTRGFLGDYDVEMTLPSGIRTMPLAATAGKPLYAAAGAQAKVPVLLAVTNAAGYQKDAVAPGEMVTLFVDNAGAPQLAQAYGDADRELPRLTGDTRVLFDGVPAAMVYSVRNQISAIVPYGVSGSTRVQIEYMGIPSAELRVAVRDAVPGLFSDDYSGKKQAVAVNADGHTRNNASQPAARGEFVTLFITGEGAVSPATRDGVGPVAPYPAPVAPVRVSFGGVEAAAADQWVGLVYAGVTQINVRVPLEAPAGAAIPVVVKVGGTASQEGMTVALR